MPLAEEGDLAPRPGSLCDGLLRVAEFARSQAASAVAEDLVSHYSGVSEDEKLERATREAAMLYCVAEGHLNEQEADQALQAAKDAAELFRKQNDPSGVASALRIIIGANHMMGQPAEAAEMAAKELEAFKAAGDKHGEASMLFASGDLSMENCNPEEGLRFYKESAALLQSLNDDKMTGALQLAMVSAHMGLNRPMDAIEAAGAAVETFSRLGDKKALGKAMHALAKVHLVYEAPEDAFEAAKKALACAEEVEDDRAQVMAMNTMAVAQLDMEDPLEAQRYAHEASALSRKTTFARGEVEAVNVLVSIQSERGDRQDALEQAKEGVSWSQRVASKRMQAAALDVLVNAHLVNREYEAALKAAWEAMEILRDLGDKRGHAATLLRVSMLHLLNSQENWAMQAVDEATDIAKEVEDRRGEAGAMYTLIHVHLQRNENKEAIIAGTKAERLFKDLFDRRMMGSTLLAVARVHMADGNAKFAVSCAQRAMGFFEEAADRKGAASAALTMAGVHFQTQSFDRALKAARKAQNILSKVGHMRSQAIALHMIAGALLSADEPDQSMKYAEEMRTLCKKVQDKQGEGHAMHIFTRANIGQIWKEADKLEALKPQDRGEPEEEGEVKMSYGIPGVSTADKTPQVPEEKDPRYEKAVVQHAKVMEATENALNIAKEAVAVARKSDDKELLGMVMYSLGQVQLVAGKSDDALKTGADALTLGLSSGVRHTEALALILMSEVYFVLLRAGEAVDSAEKGLKICKKIGDWAGEDYAKRVLEAILGEQAGGMDDDDAGAESAGDAGGAVVAFTGLDPSFVRAELRDQVAQLVGIDDGDMGDDTPLMDSGMDSLSSVEFRNTVAKEFRMNLPATLTFDFPSVKALTEFIVEQSKAEADDAGGGGGADTSSAGRSTQKSAIKSNNAAAAKAAAAALKAAESRIKQPCIAGTWDNWGVHEMTFNTRDKYYAVTIRCGRNGWESFQILYGGDWKRCIYPDQKDANPHVTHKLCGPDDDGAGKNWTVGMHANDKGSEGVCFEIMLMVGDDGSTASKVEWTRLGTGAPGVLEASMPKAKQLARHMPYIVGTMNSWGQPKVMTWTPDGGFFQYRITIGGQGWESFQILFNGEWRRCLHPDKKDGCPHSQYELMGPDDAGDGLNWTIGAHPLDKGGPGVSFQIRLLMKGGEEGIPRSVDWVRL